MKTLINTRMEQDLMSNKKLREAKEKEEERILLIGDFYESKLKNEYSFFNESYLSLRYRMRIMLNVFLSLCVVNALIITITIILYIQPYTINLFLSSYSSETESVLFLPYKYTDDESRIRVLFGANSNEIKNKILVVDKIN